MRVLCIDNSGIGGQNLETGSVYYAAKDVDILGVPGYHIPEFDIFLDLELTEAHFYQWRFILCGDEEPEMEEETILNNILTH